ncbi:hypothetical protein [Paenibacillus amylolyticus]|uniref:hypothetical protein n=1 Tax=Paenibacillus amylolyticus TaxID=1451 RepID=UPI00344F4D53
MTDKILNGYYHYYNNVLKKKSFTDEQVVKEIKTRFDSKLEIKISSWGRTSKYKTIEIKKDEYSDYVIPMLNPNEIITQKMTLGQKLREDYQWVLPPYIQMRIIYEMIRKREINDLELLYKGTYNTGYFVSQLATIYSDSDLIKNYMSLIEESIECFLFKKYAGAITLLLTVVEGISRDFCDSVQISYNKQGSSSAFCRAIQYRKEIWKESILFRAGNRKIILPIDYLNDEVLIKVDEAMDMFVSFEQYGVDYLYKSNTNFSLNRHSILHGVNKDYYIPINFYRLFSCLEMLVLVVTNIFMARTIDDHEKAYKLFKKFDYIENARAIQESADIL